MASKTPQSIYVPYKVIQEFMKLGAPKHTYNYIRGEDDIVNFKLG